MFLTLGITLAVALAAGYSTGGRMRRLADLRIAGLPFVFAALVLGLAPLVVEMPDALGRVLVAAANVVVLACVAVNLRRHRGAVRAGMAVIAAGWALNAVVIAANGGMPLSRWAYAQSGQTDPITEGEGGFFKIVAAGPGSRLRPLGDVIPIEPLRQVLSVGDLLLMAGIGVVVAGGMRDAGGGERDTGGERDASRPPRGEIPGGEA